MIDLISGQISFFKDGVDLGVAFELKDLAKRALEQGQQALLLFPLIQL